jgi:hypothetical protein
MPPTAKCSAPTSTGSPTPTTSPFEIWPASLDPAVITPRDRDDVTGWTTSTVTRLAALTGSSTAVCCTPSPSYGRSPHPAPTAHHTAHRLKLLGEDPYGDPHRPSPDRIELVIYPETITLIALSFASVDLPSRLHGCPDSPCTVWITQLT